MKWIEQQAGPETTLREFAEMLKRQEEIGRRNELDRWARALSIISDRLLREPDFDPRSLRKPEPDAPSEETRLRHAVNAACAIVELGDQRLLASDGPAGNQAPDLTLAEWRELYTVLNAARQRDAARPA